MEAFNVAFYKIFNHVVWVCVLLVLGGCAPRPHVEVVERSVLTVRAQTEKIGGPIIRIVQPGDTLHGIAFGAGLNVNDIAAWNGVVDTRRLNVGQQIRLTKPLNYRPPKINKVTTNKNPSASTPSGAQQSSSRRQTTARAKPATSKLAVRNAQQASGENWSWPTQGKVIGRYALAQGKQGIDILGKLGQSVVASDAGEVVYVGSGLKGYGKLIIVKHNERYLSAYAHNQHIVVEEGQYVASKQKIGAVGVDRKGRNTLHFQIRRDGKPVNPLAFLPTL